VGIYGLRAAILGWASTVKRIDRLFVRVETGRWLELLGEVLGAVAFCHAHSKRMVGAALAVNHELDHTS
jgi:hypothetical protein